MSPIIHVLLGVFSGFLISIPLKVFVLNVSWRTAFYDFFQYFTALIAVGIVYSVFYGV